MRPLYHSFFLAGVVGVLALLTNNAVAAQLADTDLPGGTYQTIQMRAPLPAICQQACEGDRRCKAWSFSWPGRKGPRAQCFLKDVVPAAKANNCCISGVRTTPVPVEPPKSNAGKKAQRDRDEDCLAYANESLIQVYLAGRLDCGFSGKKWSGSLETHYLWCERRKNKKRRQARLDERTKRLAACRLTSSRSETDENDPERVCRQFAAGAVADFQTNERFGCGFSGDLWRVNYAEHLAWCLKSSDQQRKERIKARKEVLGTCRPGEPTPELCAAHAAHAVEQALENRKRGCGFSGRIWRTSKRRHEKWCLKAGARQRARVEKLRATSLEICAKRPRKIGICRRFAQKAIQDVRDSRQAGCVLTGPVWSRSYLAHLSWCIDASKRARQQRASTRLVALQDCRLRRPSAGAGPLPLGVASQYRFRWRRVGDGSPWASIWQDSAGGATCLHTSQCRCGFENFCGTFRNGAVVRWWRNGCGRRPWRIRCSVRRK